MQSALLLNVLPPHKGALSALSRLTAAALMPLAMASAPALLPAQALDTPRLDLPVPNGNVLATLVDGDTVYIGGEFTSLGPVVGRVAKLDMTTGEMIRPFPLISNSSVFSILPDEKGGWYIGGQFTLVDGDNRSGLFHVLADGSLNPNFRTVVSGSSGAVDDMVLHDGALYIAGRFLELSQQACNLALLDATTGIARTPFPQIGRFSTGDEVNASISDGAGGWFIGGIFSHLDGVRRNNIAHILADGTVDPFWDPDSDGEILDLVVSGSTIYVAGAFTRIGGQSRNRIAELDLHSGLATSWNPDSDGPVLTLAVSDSTVFAGGDFSVMGGQLRMRLAAIDRVTGTVTPWDPLSPDWNTNTSLSIQDLIVTDTLVYAGGIFSEIGGKPRGNIAALDIATGEATDWNPDANNTVLAMELSGSTLYAGGEFTSIGGQSRNRIAALDVNVDSGNALAWNPDANQDVLTLTLSGTTLYAGGLFSEINGQPRRRAAALDSTVDTDMVTSWDPRIPLTNSEVHTISTSGSELLVGGRYFRINEVMRRQFAALDPETGAVLPLVANIDGVALRAVLAVSDSTIYLGGGFSGINGQSRSRLGAVDRLTGQLLDWNPGVDNPSVQDLLLDGTTLYVSGAFTTLAGGQSRSRFAAFDTTSGELLPWAPSFDGTVQDMALKGSTLYVGGAFSSPRNNLAAFDTATGDLLDWSPNIGSSPAVWSLGVSGDKVVIAGGFSEFNGLPRSHLVVVDAVTGELLDWVLNPNQQMRAVAVWGNTACVGGFMTSMGGETRNRIAAFDNVTGQLLPWNPNADGTVRRLAKHGSTIYAAGDFTNISSQPRERLAALDANTGAATTWNPEPNNRVEAIAATDSAVYLGGYFTSVGGEDRNRIAAVNPDTGLATDWDPDADEHVMALAVSGSTIYAGGFFTNIGGAYRNYIAALDSVYGTATDWNPGPSSPVIGLSAADNFIYASGWFNDIAGEARRGVAELDATTGDVTPWSSQLSANPDYTAASASAVFLGGSFTTSSGASRESLAAVDRATGEVTDWNPDPRQTIETLALSGSTVYVGGRYSSIAGTPVGYLAGFYLESDGDAIANFEEDQAPNSGDGNGDAIPDSTQHHVVSLQAGNSGIWLTLVAPSEAYRLRNVRLQPQHPPYPDGVKSFPFGRIIFELDVPTPGETCQVLLYYSAIPFPESIDNLYYWNGAQWTLASSFAELDGNLRRFTITYEDGGPADLANHPDGLIRGILSPSFGGTTLRVDLVRFDATARGIGQSVDIQWETAAEFMNAGFNIYRVGDKLHQLNEWPLPPLGDEVTGAVYDYVDETPLQAGEVRRYMLEDVEFSGRRTLHGPATVGPLEAEASHIVDWALYD
jgi:hypothetical protein